MITAQYIGVLLLIAVRVHNYFLCSYITLYVVDINVFLLFVPK